MAPDALEARQLFASVNLSSGVLTVTGDSTNDTIVVYLIDGMANDQIYVVINGSSPPYGGYDAANVSLIDIYPNIGNDTVTIETDAEFSYGNLGGVNENTRVFCEAGHDTVFGGDFADEIHGEMGSDDLYGRSGDDTLYGGYGGDPSLDSVGNDTLTGGPGADILYGGGGDDWFDMADGAGNDNADGGDGSDTVLNSDSGDNFTQ